jgi:hypothetical protein
MNNLYDKIDSFINESVKIPGKPAWLVFCGYAIGETVTFCALAGEFKHHHGHDIVIVITPKHQQVINMYAQNFAKIVAISDESMQLVLRSGYIPQDRFELDKAFSPCWIDRGYRDSDGMRFLWKYPGRGGISESDLARMVLHLPWNAKLEAPFVSEPLERSAFALALNNGMRIGRSVLLCPINNSAPRLPLLFWNEVAKALIQKGLTVFTNMGGHNPYNGLSSMPIEDTIPVDLPIDHVIPFIRLAGSVISGGNGMLHLTFMADNKKFELTHLIPYSVNAIQGHSSLGFRSATHPEIGNHLAASMQYEMPELCQNTRMAEFIIPYDGDEADLIHLANVVANRQIDDASCIHRKGTEGKCYVTENRGWLAELRSCEN